MVLNLFIMFEFEDEGDSACLGYNDKSPYAQYFQETHDKPILLA
jgi:hypothetical protein